VGVSWFEAVAYCRWLEAQTGIPFQLPTEAEWEKAARGPDGLIWPWGNTWKEGLCNSKEAGIGKTTLVGNYPKGASPSGALDMAGNVWEWCATKWRKDYPYTVEDEWTAEYLAGDNGRMLRGGSWVIRRGFVRGALRYDNNPRFRYNRYGLRLARHSPLPGSNE
jgi:formylglycine-generating enzyme required for sulfatase activity